MEAGPFLSDSKTAKYADMSSPETSKNEQKLRSISVSGKVRVAVPGDGGWRFKCALAWEVLLGLGWEWE